MQHLNRNLLIELSLHLLELVNVLLGFSNQQAILREGQSSYFIERWALGEKGRDRRVFFHLF